MRTFFFVFALAIAALTACNHDSNTLDGNSTLDDATILGIDYRRCASPYCGGWFIEIGGDTLRFLEVPAQTDIDLYGNAIFPISVKVRWHQYENEWSDIEGLIYLEEAWMQ